MSITNVSLTDLGVVSSIRLVTLEVQIWSARKKMKPEDFGNIDLPPEELATLGSIKSCDPEDLKDFGKLKARAVTILENSGIPFMKGWAIPEANAGEVIQKLDDIEQDFDQAKADFLLNYEKNTNAWIRKHPKYADKLRKYVLDVENVRKRFGFKSVMARVAVPDESSTPAERRGFENEVKGLGNVLFEETAKAAKDTWLKCFAGKTSVSHKALSPLRTIHNKLVTLSFVEPHAAPIADLVMCAFKALPKRGHITGAPLIMLQGIVSLLQDTETLIEHAKMLINGQEPENILAVLTNGITSDADAEAAEDQDAALGEDADTDEDQSANLPGEDEAAEDQDAVLVGEAAPEPASPQMESVEALPQPKAPKPASKPAATPVAQAAASLPLFEAPAAMDSQPKPARRQTSAPRPAAVPVPKPVVTAVDMDGLW